MKDYAALVLSAIGLLVTILLALSASSASRDTEFRALRERVLVIETKQQFLHGDFAVPSKGN